MGLTCPKNSIGGEAGVNDDWASCVIQIGDLTGLSSDERRLVFAHEIGHALKLEHETRAVPTIMREVLDDTVSIAPTIWDKLALWKKLEEERS